MLLGTPALMELESGFVVLPVLSYVRDRGEDITGPCEGRASFIGKSYALLDPLGFVTTVFAGFFCKLSDSDSKFTFWCGRLRWGADLATSPKSELDEDPVAVRVRSSKPPEPLEAPLAVRRETRVFQGAGFAFRTNLLIVAPKPTGSVGGSCGGSVFLSTLTLMFHSLV